MDSAEAERLREGRYQPAGHAVRVVRVPANGEAMSVITIKTINSSNKPPYHEPDFIGYWGVEGWVHRATKPVHMEAQSDPSVSSAVNTANWYVFFSQVENLPRNAHYSIARGDAFLVKMDPLQYGNDGRALYGDVPDDWYTLNGIQAILRTENPPRARQPRGRR